MDHEQHFTFCCLGHSDLNSHIFFTLGKPHKPKHKLSTLSFKEDGKVCIGKT